MSHASNTAGLVGKFGSTSFTSISRGKALPPRYPKQSKFFKSRNLKDVENVIEEEEDVGETPTAAGSVSSAANKIVEECSEIEHQVSLTADASSSQSDSNDTEDSDNVTGQAEVTLANETTDISCIEDNSLSLDSTVIANNLSLSTPKPGGVKDSRIKVAVRSRPFLPRELAKVPPEENVLDVTEDQVIVALKKPFRFDQIFGAESTQDQLYQAVVQSNVHQVIEGHNASVFAYGQTGTGKTFTMGTNNTAAAALHTSAGIIPRAIKQIFEKDNASNIKVSFYEILNEQVFDLINPSGQRVPLAVREVPNQAVFKIPQLTSMLVGNAEETLQLLEKGSRLRSTEATNLNKESSRSHAIFTITLAPTPSNHLRKLNLVDLAGSESVKRTQATGNRFAEGVNINKGLLSLGNVVRALTEKKAHIPYRDSLLTRVLKECLQVSSYISMIACVSPTGTDMNETINTLRFANRAKELITKPVPVFLMESVGMSAARKRKYADQIAPTPGGQRWNNTISTPTPSKVTKKVSSQRQLNLTIGTPGKRARGEACFMTPTTFKKTATMTSTVLKQPEDHGSPDSPTFSNISGVSMIQPPDDTIDLESHANAFPQATSQLESKTFNMLDMSSVFSPYMKKINETIREEFRKLNSEYRMNPDCTPKVKSRARPRMTSSPVRLASKTITDVEDISEDNSLETNPRIIVNSHPSPSETIISGTGVSLPLSDLTNKRLQSVIQSGSPVFNKNPAAEHCPSIPVYDSPPSTANPKPGSSTNCAASSPTLAEMERALGIDSGSPGMMFCAPTSSKPKEKRDRARSSRRTTMMGRELETTLQFIRESTASNRRLSERPLRAAAQGVFYGSPRRENARQDNVTQGAEACKHPLMNENNKIDPDRQRDHNRSILTLLNTGNLKLLTALPAIGPKTGLILHGYRQLNGGINSIQELETINGLGPKFFKKFITQNQIVLGQD